MNVGVGVIIGIYGDLGYWSPLAEKALASVASQTVLPDKVVVSGGDTLAAARNQAAGSMDTDHLIFLDADDELDPKYIEEMLKVEGDIRRPATLGIVDGVEDDEPIMIPRSSLIDRNFVVIGAMIPRAQFLKVGGFDDYPILEDWALFLKMWIDGASIVDVPKAIYRVNVRPASRNQNPGSHANVYSEIRRRFLPEAQLAGLI